MRKFGRKSTVIITCLITILSSVSSYSAEPSDGVSKDSKSLSLRNDSDQDYGAYTYAKPKWHTFISQIPGDMVDVSKETFRKENIPGMLFMAAGTALLIWRDPYIIEKAVKLGDKLGISHTAYQKTVLTVGGKAMFEGPFDSGSTLYFLGDGWTHAMIAASFLGYGAATNNNRAIQTASEIGESVIGSGAVVQVIKHVTGRESPFVATEPRGAWHFFPNQIDYAHHVPSYDAFPTGHLAASMAVVTVIGNNYPEYPFVRPVGYSLMTLLGFQMLNNGVHWASDYPLGIWLGYVFGKMAVRKGRKPRLASAKNYWEFSPTNVSDGVGLMARYHFSNKSEKEGSKEGSNLN